jgi:two-component system, NtrC family, sensor histidine kinase HydH
VRNPLAGIKGAVQILMSRRSVGDTELPVMGDIIARIDSLNEPISDLMLFARPRPPKPVATELGPLVQDAITMVRRDPSAQAIKFSVEGDTVVAAVDPEMVRATVLNLLLNAAQAMAGKGGIRITISRRDDSAAIEVRDSGPGIPPDIQRQVFEPFFTTKARGGGLGLPIAKRAAEMHDGSLTLTCPPEGGTAVVLLVPIASKGHPANASVRSDLTPGADGRGRSDSPV